MKKELILVLLLFSFSVSASDMGGNEWLNQSKSDISNANSNPVEAVAQQKAVDYQIARCISRIDRYKVKLNRNPDSGYYQSRMSVWVKRCDGVVPLENIPEAYRLEPDPETFIGPILPEIEENETE